MTTARQIDPKGGVYAPLRVVRPDQLSGATAQTAGMQRLAAISHGTVGAQRIFMGRTTSQPGARSLPHHHGDSETALFISRGRAYFLFGEGLRERVEVGAGDFLYVPAWAIHVEATLGDAECELIVARSTQEAIVVNLPDLLQPAADGDAD